MGNVRLLHASPVMAATVMYPPQVEADGRNIVAYMERRPKRTHEWKDIQKDCSLSYGRVENAIKYLKAGKVIEQVKPYHYRLDPNWRNDIIAGRVADEIRLEKAVSDLATALESLEEDAQSVTKAIDAATAVQKVEPVAEPKPQPKRRVSERGETVELVRLAVYEKPGLNYKDIAAACDLTLGQTSAALYRLVGDGTVRMAGQRKPHTYWPSTMPTEQVAPKAVFLEPQDGDEDLLREAEEKVARAQERALADEMVKQAERRKRVDELARNLAIARGIDPKYLEE